MELPDTTSGVPLVLARSVKIRPGGNLEVPLECTRQLTDQMDIRIDTGFHHKNPNICRATTRPPRPSSTAECLRLIACLRGEQASAASWEPRPPFEAAEMD